MSLLLNILGVNMRSGTAETVQFNPGPLIKMREQRKPVKQTGAFLDQLKMLNERMNIKDETKRASIDYIAALAEMCPVPMWIKDLDLRVIWINEATESVFEVTLDQVLGKKSGDVWSEDSAKEFEESDYIALREGQWTGILRTRRKDGHYEKNLAVKYVIYDGPEAIGIAGMVCCVFP